MSPPRGAGPDAREIRLVPVGPVDAAVLDALRAPLGRRFERPVVRDTPVPLRAEWCDGARGQYRADPILDALVAVRDLGWTLGIVDADLYVPGLSFIFGQATVDGCCAVIGLARLRPEFYGEPPRPSLFFRRALTEAVHELGHVAGLAHCPRPDCVMHFSSTLEDTDRKGTEFCPRCRE